MIAPLPFRWTGEAMEPLPRFRQAADAQFVIGDTYRMEALEERSLASHNHYFAELHDRWLSLPEYFGDRFPTPEHLRKYALVKAGYHDQRSIVAASKAEAQRIAGFVRPIDEFAVVTVSEAVVTVYTAKSQSMKAMGKQDFQASKDAVLAILDDMLGTNPPVAADQPGRHPAAGTRGEGLVNPPAGSSPLTEWGK